MKPIEFEHSNHFLFASDEIDYGSVGKVEPLSVWTDGEQCVSCWQMSIRERVSALLFGKVWVAVLSGETQPPITLDVGKNYFKIDDKEKER